MNPFSAPDAIYISRKPQDMRAGIQRLAAVVAADFGCGPADGAPCCFVSRDCEEAKPLRFDVNGWCMHCVRPSEGGFRWRHAEGGGLLPQLERRQLPWLLEGLPAEPPRPYSRSPPEASFDLKTSLYLLLYGIMHSWGTLGTYPHPSRSHAFWRGSSRSRATTRGWPPTTRPSPARPPRPRACPPIWRGGCARSWPRSGPSATGWWRRCCWPTGASSAAGPRRWPPTGCRRSTTWGPPPAPGRPSLRRRGGKRRVDFSKLEQVVVRRELPGPDRRRPECGHPLEEFKVEVTYALRMVPARLVAERRERAACRCPGCRGADAAGEGVPAPIVRAPAPAAPAKGSFAAPSLIACVPNGKCASALPPCRTGCDSKCLGAPTSGQDMADWTVRAWEL